MKTKTWKLTPWFYQPFWDESDQILLWNEEKGSSIFVELPNCISSPEEAEKFLRRSAYKWIGRYPMNWNIEEH